MPSNILRFGIEEFTVAVDLPLHQSVCRAACSIVTPARALEVRWRRRTVPAQQCGLWLYRVRARHHAATQLDARDRHRHHYFGRCVSRSLQRARLFRRYVILLPRASAVSNMRHHFRQMFHFIRRQRHYRRVNGDCMHEFQPAVSRCAGPRHSARLVCQKSPDGFPRRQSHAVRRYQASLPRRHRVRAESHRHLQASKTTFRQQAFMQAYRHTARLLRPRTAERCFALQARAMRKRSDARHLIARPIAHGAKTSLYHEKICAASCRREGSRASAHSIVDIEILAKRRVRHYQASSYMVSVTNRPKSTICGTEATVSSLLTK